MVRGLRLRLDPTFEEAIHNVLLCHTLNTTLETTLGTDGQVMDCGYSIF